ncbi:AsnC family transcriptional regulator [Actibacterium mucosum KCTC 23349]|uniref:AsnC family transcriptional regulator n=1 Tax=Actibacterium mucosum KCTC 23349 TaxID=1454373 RepID=A0A037ZHD2_9RHOB|nr:Lrp/AsnC family transcriptional regulator [Actibacterium mucosum]KAJ54225.1 AsnC family transcriptional regulator [Actibacterium mucosum KCTC 23349]
MQPDDTDRRLLRHWQSDPDLSMADLAERAGVSASVAWRRLEKMRREGVIGGVRARVNWRALGYAVQVSLRITLEKTNPRAFDEFLVAARTIPEVNELQTFLGRVDVRLSVLARDMGHYQQVYREQILSLPHIADLEALMHVAEIKNNTALPL